MPAKKKDVVVYTAYVDSIKFTGKYAVPRDLQVGPEASAAIIAHIAPELHKAQVSTQNLAVHFECPRPVGNMPIGDFAAAGGVAVVFSLDGSQLLSKIVTLETDFAKEKASKENLRKLNTQAMQKVRDVERALEEFKKNASPEIIAENQQVAEEKKATEPVKDQVETSKANLETSVKLKKAISVLQARQYKQSQVLKGLLDQQKQMMDQQKQMMQLMEAQNAALDFT